MRLIDADALDEVLEKIPAADIKNIDGQAYVLVRLSQVFNVIEHAPTIEPGRKKGEWIEDGYNHYKAVCSKCGEPCGTYVMGKPRDRFCKWCGADMREEGDPE